MVKVYVMSAFSKDGAGGNRAGVVFDRADLSVEEKKTISARLGYSETAFVTASEKADYHIEYFTPTDEVPLCGHATIATFAAMHLLGKLSKSDVSIETLAGILTVHVDADGTVMMEQNAPQYFDFIDEREMEAFMGVGAIESGKPIRIVSTGLHDVLLPIKDLGALDALRPDLAAMSDFSAKHEVVGIHAFAELHGGAIDAVCRDFAPLYGIDEESATGTASCALAGYLYSVGRRQETYIFEQGYTMGLPSRITVKVADDGERITRIFVGGQGYLVEELEM